MSWAGDSKTPGSYERVNLQQTDLSDADLITAYLRGVDLSEANLSEAFLHSADLGQAILTKAINLAKLRKQRDKSKPVSLL